MARVRHVALRERLIERAKNRCEYCQLPDDIGWAIHEVDHVIARKHGGKTVLGNLAYACPPCNRHKGTDYRSFDPLTGKDTRLFNPRLQAWHKHFQLNDDGIIIPRTPESRATVQLLRLNDPSRVQQRADIMALDKLPSESE